MDEAVGGFAFGDADRERVWTAISTVRDARPRLADDADTDDIVDALLPVLGGIVDRRIAARGAGGDTAWHDAGLETRHAWDRFAQARTPVETADAITALGDAVAQLSMWLPGYDHDTGTILAPGEEPDGEHR